MIFMSSRHLSKDSEGSNKCPAPPSQSPKNMRVSDIWKLYDVDLTQTPSSLKLLWCLSYPVLLSPPLSLATGATHRAGSVHLCTHTHTLKQADAFIKKTKADCQWHSEAMRGTSVPATGLHKSESYSAALQPLLNYTRQTCRNTTANHRGWSVFLLFNTYKV